MGHDTVLFGGISLALCFQSTIFAGTARYELPHLAAYVSTEPVNDPAPHWAEVVLHEARSLGLNISCYFADAHDHGELRQGEHNNDLVLTRDLPGRYQLTSGSKTAIFAQVPFKDLRYCSLVLYHLSGYALFQGERLDFHDRILYIANNSTVSWRPGDTGPEVSAKVEELLRRHKLVASVYYKPYVYLTMEDKSL